MAQDQELDIIVDEPDVASRKWMIGGAAVAAIVVVGFILYTFVLSDDDGSAVEQAIEEVAVERGTLTDTLVTTGSAAASRQSELLFPSSGQVSEVAVELGDTLEAGQVLASLDSADAERDVETAQVNLDLAVLRLDQMTEPPTAAEAAAAESSVEQAKAALARLIAAPTEAAVAAAEASVEQARSSFESLTASLSASDVAAADVAVEQAQTALERLLNTASPVVAAEAGRDRVGQPHQRPDQLLRRYRCEEHPLSVRTRFDSPIRRERSRVDSDPHGAGKRPSLVHRGVHPAPSGGRNLQERSR